MEGPSIARPAPAQSGQADIIVILHAGAQSCGNLLNCDAIGIDGLGCATHGSAPRLFLSARSQCFEQITDHSLSTRSFARIVIHVDVLEVIIHHLVYENKLYTYCLPLDLTTVKITKLMFSAQIQKNSNSE